MGEILSSAWVLDKVQAVKVLKARCGSWGAKPADEEIDETSSGSRQW